MKWSKQITRLALVLSFVTLSPRLAFAYDCNSWNGAYNTGGYNLYSFGTDLYSYTDYITTTTTTTYGGGCGSFGGTCSGGYDTSGLYGSGGVSPYSIDINNTLMNLILQDQQLLSGTTSPYMSSGNQYPPVPGVIPPAINYPGFTGIPGMPYSPTPIWPYSPIVPTMPTYPPPPIVVNPITPPPTTALPYGGCDNIVVMCPSGTPYRPTTIMPTTVATPVTPTTITTPTTVTSTPVYQTTTTTQPTSQSPVRYTVPRGNITTSTVLTH